MYLLAHSRGQVSIKWNRCNVVCIVTRLRDRRSGGSNSSSAERFCCL